jgi:hypothetical protein
MNGAIMLRVLGVLAFAVCCINGVTPSVAQPMPEETQRCAFGQTIAHDAAGERFGALGRKIAQSCIADPEGEICQIYLHGLTKGVGLMTIQARRTAEYLELKAAEVPDAATWATAIRSIVCMGHGDSITSFPATMRVYIEDLKNLKGRDATPLHCVANTDGMSRLHVVRLCRSQWQEKELAPGTPLLR